jgi:hypothetical protein
MTFHQTAPGLDDLLLDLATVIELSDHDRDVADNRYRRLKIHLERPSSPLRQYLLNGASLIYPQGSMAIGATIVSGTDDDRFDVDALVEMKVPSHWSDDEALDKLFEALQGFPGVQRIVRCTRCVQLQFAFMHMDVTILDPAAEPRPERVGEIFHSPDKGSSYRVPANPYGFGHWYCRNVQYPSESFIKELQERRRGYGVNRLALSVLEKAEQEQLPPMVPPRVDAQQVIALKLTKRFLNLQYGVRNLKRPPSVYVTKLSQTCGYEPAGLTAQLERLAHHIKTEMEVAWQNNAGPDERNPSYDPDRLNDRWPKSQQDRSILAQDMDVLLGSLKSARRAEFKDVGRVLATLFGERVSARTVETFMNRRDQRSERKSAHYERGTGAVLASPAVAAPAVARSSSPIRQHNFHCESRAAKK